MLDFTKAKRIEYYYVQNKNSSEKRTIYIFDCLNCTNELRLYGKTGVSKTKGYCRYCSSKFIKRKPNVILNCPVCNILFSVKQSRQEKTNDDICCSMNCRKIRIKKDPSKHSSYKYHNEIDRFLALKHNRLKRSAQKRKKEFNITKEYLINLYHSQKGKCYYTNLNLETKKGLFLLSVDRIDNNKGYIENNIVFCCNGINSLKQHFKEEEVRNFIKLIIKNDSKN